MSFRGPGRRRRSNNRYAQGPRRILLLLALLILLLALLVPATLILRRSFGGEVSATSVARNSLNSGTKPHIRLINGAGEIVVEGVKDADSVDYVVKKYALGSDAAEAREQASRVPVDVSRQDSTLAIETDGGRSTGADYEVRVPAGSSVELESEVGDVTATDLTGTVTVRAGSGDVTVRDAGGDVTIEAAQGDVAVSDVRTDTGKVEVSVGAGDVGLENLSLGTLETRVETGSVILSGRFSGSGRVLVRTGEIISRLPPEDTRDLVLKAIIGEVVREESDGGH